MGDFKGEDDNYDYDEGIPLFNQVIFTNSYNNSKVVLDDNQDDIIFITPPSPPPTLQTKKQCEKGCCGEKKSLLTNNDEDRDKDEDEEEDDDDGVPKNYKSNSNVGSIVSLDMDSLNSAIIMEPNFQKDYTISSPVVTTTTTTTTTTTSNDNCKKGCCPTPSDDEKMITKDDKGSCKKGCCSSSSKTTETNDIGCKKGCCPTEQPKQQVESTKTYCCNICVTGHCCKVDCCKQVCCLTYSVGVPNFSFMRSSSSSDDNNNDYNSDQQRKKRIFATMFSKTCGTFGFKVGYSELNEDKVDIEQQEERDNKGLSTNNNVSIELLPITTTNNFKNSTGIKSSQSSTLSKSLEKVELHLMISGMTCADCVTTLEQKMKSLSGVNEIQTSLFTGKCKINYSPMIIQPQQILQVIENIGFVGKQVHGQSSNSNQITIEIISLSPTSTLTTILNDQLIENIKLSIDGVLDAIEESGSVNDKLTIVYDTDKIGPRNLLKEIQLIFGDNFKIQPNTKLNNNNNSNNKNNNSKDNNNNNLKSLLMFCILLFIPTILISYIFPNIKSVKEVMEFEIGKGITMSILLLLSFATPIQFYCGKPLYISAWKTLIYARKCSMDLLVMTSSTIAYFYSLINLILNHFSSLNYNGPIFFETCVILLTLIILGRYLEHLAKSKASNVLVEKMKQLDSSNAILLSNNNNKDVGSEQEIMIEKELIEKGDILKVLPFTKIPTDGIIIRGNGGYIDESIITGEANHVYKRIDDYVFGGTMNQKGCLIIKVTKHSNDTALSNIIKLVEESQSIKPNFQNYADLVASYFVPTILICSIITFIVWFCLIHYNVVIATDNQSAFTFAIKISMSLMVISCPCAISLATPTSIMVGSAIGAKKFGILFKGGGQVIELASKVNKVIFDKTGTLTTGEIDINHFSIYDQSISPKQFFFYTASAELSSEHLIGKSIKQYAIQQFTLEKALQEPTNSEVHPGKGIISFINNNKIMVGNQSFIVEQLSNNNNKIDSCQSPLQSSQLINSKSDDCKKGCCLSLPPPPPPPTSISNGSECKKGCCPAAAAPPISTGNGSDCKKGCCPSLPPPPPTSISNSSDCKKGCCPAPPPTSISNGSDCKKGCCSSSSSQLSKSQSKEVIINSVIQNDIDKLENQGKTVILVSMNEKIIGLVSLSDKLKPEAKKVISKLKNNGIDVWLVSGDNKRATQSIGEQLNINSGNIIGSALPIDKFNIVRKLQGYNTTEDNCCGTDGGDGFNGASVGCSGSDNNSNNGKNKSIVVMVGDGVNDSLALVQSDIGISISNGTDIAIESSSVILLKNDLNDILVCFDLSKSIFKTIKFNLFWAFIYNLLGIPLSSGILYPWFTIPPALAGLSELLSSLPVVLFSLTLNNYKYQNKN
ncbi:P-type ATPase [Dictyostelium discoideum AX4]|uniref:P-type ATPase n=1 Tax=Dictyostelium discoideum TaxID=44689 RepID=Q55DN5_DICDI|nr:P-type ATPase [Dictyostelium discoideum AX4]EAL72145.2 P-type ATPase [Dictyostelium discoideum AX4]|eukprot:XP_646096.2 P-type ATPase [Dictyostelium discoideum AX4]